MDICAIVSFFLRALCSFAVTGLPLLLLICWTDIHTYNHNIFFSCTYFFLTIMWYIYRRFYTVRVKISWHKKNITSIQMIRVELWMRGWRKHVVPTISICSHPQFSFPWMKYFLDSHSSHDICEVWFDLLILAYFYFSQFLFFLWQIEFFSLLRFEIWEKVEQVDSLYQFNRNCVTRKNKKKYKENDSQTTGQR